MTLTDALAEALRAERRLRYPYDGTTYYGALAAAILADPAFREALTAAVSAALVKIATEDDPLEPDEVIVATAMEPGPPDEQAAAIVAAMLP